MPETVRYKTLRQDIDAQPTVCKHHQHTRERWGRNIDWLTKSWRGGAENTSQKE